MKILLLAENWPPRVGGIERYLAGMAGELAKQHKITVIAPASPDDALPAADEKMGGNVTVIRKKFFWLFIKPAWLPLYVYIHRLVQHEKFDLVLCGKGLFEGLVGYYLKKRLNIPYIVCTYYMEINEWQKKPSTLRKLRRVFTSADHVIIITEAIRKTIESLGAAPKNILKIHPAVDVMFLARIRVVRNTASTSTEPVPVPEKYTIENPYILSVSRLIPRKGLDDLIHAFAKLDQTKFADVDLVIVGDGPQRSELEKIAEQEYVRPVFLGNVPSEDLPGLYTNAQLFALTPKELEGDIEGFGIVFLEAGAAGLASLGTKTGGVPEAIEHDKTGLLAEPGNIDEIYQLLTRLLSDKKLRERLGHNAEQHVRVDATWPVRLRQLYKHLKT